MGLLSEPGATAGVPPCKGCGSTKLKATSVAIIVIEYTEPTHAERGLLHFAWSYAGTAERERYSIECADCGRRMRTNLAPVSDD